MQVNAYYSYLYVLYLGIFLNFKDIAEAVIFLSVLACLLTYNFISTSIRLTKRNIGASGRWPLKLHTFSFTLWKPDGCGHNVYSVFDGADACHSIINAQSTLPSDFTADKQR